MSYIYLLISILAEVIATSFMKASDGFKNLLPSLIVIIGYTIAFYCMSLTLKSIPIGIVYATWSGLGIVLISLVAFLYYGQSLDLYAIIGIFFILAGVIIINLYSSSTVH